MSKDVHIALVNARLGYGEHIVIDELNLEFDRNKIHCVFGRNGSGKTTLLKSIAQLNPLLSGKILVEGKDIASLNAAQRSRIISTVLTHRPSIPNMQVREYVAYGRYPYLNWLSKPSQQEEEIVEQVIGKCRIQALSDRQINELSDGEFQKVQIARVMAQETPIVLLDETVAHLDLANKAEVFRLLDSMRKEKGRSIIFSSHDLQFSSQLADQFIVILDGKVKNYTKAEFLEKEVYREVFGDGNIEYDWKSNSINFSA